MKFLALFTILFATVSYADYGLVGRSISIDPASGAVKPAQGEQVFEYVYNQNGAAFVKGEVVVLDTTEADGFSVATSASAGAVPKCVMAEACANGKICKCQTYGYADFLRFENTGSGASVGHQFYISETTGGYAEAKPLATVTATDYPIGVVKATISDATSGSAKVFIRLR